MTTTGLAQQFGPDYFRKDFASYQYGNTSANLSPNDHPNLSHLIQREKFSIMFGLTEPLVEYDGVDDVFFVYHEMPI